MPKVSVILAAYNAQQYLREAITSILSQQFGDLEFLIVNDGSTDDTREIIQSFPDPRIRFIENRTNVGLTRSLNRALAKAQGEYIARQDADDISEPNRLAEQVAYLDRHSDVTLAGTWFTVIDSNGSLVRRSSLPSSDLDIRWDMFFSCPFVHGSVMWRHTPVRQQVGMYDERLCYSQDYELWTRIASHFRVGNVEAFLLRYREHAQSMTATYGDRTLEGYRLRLAGVANVLGWDGTDDEERHARFRIMIALLLGGETSELTPERARQGVEDVLAVHSAMCRLNGVAPRAARRHRSAVRARLSRALVRAGSRSAKAFHTIAAGRLLGTACRVYWPALMHRSATGLVSQDDAAQENDARSCCRCCASVDRPPR